MKRKIYQWGGAQRLKAWHRVSAQQMPAITTGLRSAITSFFFIMCYSLESSTDFGPPSSYPFSTLLKRALSPNDPSRYLSKSTLIYYCFIVIDVGKDLGFFGKNKTHVYISRNI